MRITLARWLRRAAMRLDPKSTNEWAHVATQHTHVDGQWYTTWYLNGERVA